MVLMGLLFKFAVECFNVLAWPLFALGYPLCASVQAIETNSITDTQKLVTYWICFSLISLFEHVFANLLQWSTSWPYIKLVIVSCLVVPHFEGSLYVYKHLVHPCQFVNQQTVYDWFAKLKEFYLLIEEKRKAKESGHDAAKNLAAFGSLATFKPKLEEAKFAKKESNAAPIVETKEVISTKQVSQIEPNFALSGNRMCMSKGIKETVAAKIIVGDFNDILSSKIISEDRTCDACQATTTTGEGDLVSGHNKQASEIKTPASALLGSREIVNSAVRDIPDKQHSKPVRKMWMCSVCPETATSVTDFVSHLQGKQHIDACEKQKLKEQMLKSKISPPPDAGCNLFEKLQSNSIQTPWSCTVCRVTVTSKMDLISHFQGRRHENALMQLKNKIETSRNSIFSDKMEKETESRRTDFQIPWTCGTCMVIIKGEASLVSHLQGKRHLNACDKAKCLKQTSVGQKSSPFGNASLPENTTGSTAKQQVKQVNMKSGFVEIRNSLWWCTICNISCNSEGNMNYHLNGSKHLANVNCA
ncbi:uncharacterized protein LOC130014484 isoform X2 [Mercurialis annua]|uniref:uncharacterized protein LOC130014484 isoform X2 n=1 Tax=Mercurialis annua TaxID=3986 RepID=UPI00215F33B9|nr:uncharacterized protein LOC130014484 isoform X2 [Mercurialis annua]